MNHSKVTFHNRFGITLAADMYTPKNAEGKLPAIRVCDPFGAVKVQAAGLYAQTMAERGFLTIAFARPLQWKAAASLAIWLSPDINTEDFMAVAWPIPCQKMHLGIFRTIMPTIKQKRGYHPRSLNSNGGWNVVGCQTFMNMPILHYSNEIRNAVIVLHGDKAHSCYFGKDAYAAMVDGNKYPDNKELLLVPGVSHTDLYDQTEMIPFDKIEQFFCKNLK